MEYPYHRYLTFLASKRTQYFEVVAECDRKVLLPPSDEEYQNIHRKMGPLPSFWEPHLSKNNQSFVNWLMSRDIYDLWVPDSDVHAAFALLLEIKLRGEIESLMILYNDAEKVREELAYSYPNKRLPSIEAIDIFCYYFWDTLGTPRKFFYQYLDRAQAHEASSAAALGGEVERTYALLGLKQNVDELDLLNNLVNYTNLEVRNALRMGGGGDGKFNQGLGIIAKVGMEAAERRRDIQRLEEGTSMRRDATIFKAGVAKAMPIPSIDDVRRAGVIDAEFSEAGKGEGATVHRLEVRNGSSKPS